MSKHDNSRRKLLKAAAYSAPIVLTLRSAPALATNGSYVRNERYSSAQPSVGSYKPGSNLQRKIGSDPSPSFNSKKSGSNIQAKFGSKKPKFGSKNKPKFGSKKFKKSKKS